MKTTLALSILALSLAVSAAPEHKHEHREHGAHVHGSADLSIAFDVSKGKLEFKSPADSIVGFEHKAVKPADKKKLDAAFSKFDQNIKNIVVFDAALNCTFTKEKMDVLFEAENHSDFVANYAIVCEKSPVGTTIAFNFQKYFPSLKDVDLQFLAEALQKSLEINSNGAKLELK